MRVVDDDEGENEEFKHAGWMPVGTDFLSVGGDTELDDESLGAQEPARRARMGRHPHNVSFRQVPQRSTLRTGPAALNTHVQGVRSDPGIQVSPDGVEVQAHLTS